MGPGLRERGDLGALRAIHHEMHVEVDVEVAQRAHDAGPERQRRDETPVDDVDVDDTRAGLADLEHLLTQAPVVGGEDGRGDLDRRHRAGL